jgi:hypothetical protein
MIDDQIIAVSFRGFQRQFQFLQGNQRISSMVTSVMRQGADPM